MQDFLLVTEYFYFYEYFFNLCLTHAHAPPPPHTHTHSYIHTIYIFCASSTPTWFVMQASLKSKHNVLISRARPLLKYPVQRDDGLPEEHVESDQHPVHDREDQVPAPMGVGAPAAVLQDPGEQLEAALLVPLGHRRLLHQRGGELLLRHLDDGVEVAAAMLALGSQPPRAQDGDVHVSGHPSLIIVQIYQ